MLSQNGWTALPFGSTALVDLEWITGKVRRGDVATILDYVARRFNDEVERINRSWSWGHNYRPIRGSTTMSNHASGTAIDLNAPAHPLNVAGTFSPKQVAAIQRILDDCDGVVRWGGNYAGRKDEMHFGINADAARVRTLARKITRGTAPSRPTWAPKKGIRSTLALIQIQFQISQGIRRGPIIRYNGIGRIQEELNRRLDAGLVVDGYCGKRTVAAWRRWESSLPAGQRSGRTGTPDPKSLKPLGLIFGGPEAT